MREINFDISLRLSYVEHLELDEFVLSSEATEASGETNGGQTQAGCEEPSTIHSLTGCPHAVITHRPTTTEKIPPSR